jgi:hypothetical protein
MPDELIPTKVRDYLIELKKAFGNEASTDFWDYVRNLLLADPKLMLGEARYQRTMFNGFVNDYNTLVKSGKRPNATAIYTLNQTTPPWEQLGMTEEDFATQFPNEYKQTQDWYTQQVTTPTTTDTSLLYDGLSTTEINEAANLQGITVDQWKQNWINKNYPIPTDKTSLSAWEQAQLNETVTQRQSDVELTKWKAQFGLAQDWATAEKARIMQSPEDVTKTKSEAYQTAIDEIRASLEPTDWAQKYILDIKEKQNPYVTKNMTDEEWLNKIKGQRDYLKGELKYLQDRMGDESDPLLRTQGTTDLENTIKTYISSLDTTEQAVKSKSWLPEGGSLNTLAQLFQSGKIGGFSATPGLNFTGGSYNAAENLLNQYLSGDNPELTNLSPEVRNLLQSAAQEQWLKQKPTPEPTLNIPTWLQSSISGNPSYIQGLNFNPAITPSPQTMTGWNPTQQSVWGSYVKASGGRTEDLLSQMQSMLPQPSSLGKSWKPARTI